MLDQVLKLFEITPEYDLNIMKPGQDLFDITANILTGLKPVLAAEQARLVLVHGDTTTTLAASLAAFYSQIPVGHVEAGLRTGNKLRPFPEEINRRLTGAIADLHFAPTPVARANLLREGVDPANIVVTGNTVIDALLLWSTSCAHDAAAQRQHGRALRFPGPGQTADPGHRPPARKLRRRLSSTSATRWPTLPQAQPDVEILYPVHLNPNVHKPVHDILARAS